ncbi:hypothetical protein [Microbispora hainanensis]|uniref:hypothetical protein n=1 Tax=Microbispora hainanensis TaxID=568844 RepID=UPI001ABFA80E|nr:hypothetical protein [Microbispora hainanensis]
MPTTRTRAAASARCTAALARCIERLDEALPPEDYEREDVPFEAAFLAGKAFPAYRRPGGEKR